MITTNGTVAIRHPGHTRDMRLHPEEPEGTGWETLDPDAFAVRQHRVGGGTPQRASIRARVTSRSSGCS